MSSFEYSIDITATIKDQVKQTWQSKSGARYGRCTGYV